MGLCKRRAGGREMAVGCETFPLLGSWLPQACMPCPHAMYAHAQDSIFILGRQLLVFDMSLKPSHLFILLHINPFVFMGKL